MTTPQPASEPEVVAMTALEAITRGEIDLQISTAHRFPRSMSTFKRRATDMATIDEETAESCIYVRPVGMKDGQMQYAEGLSVRLAEIVGACYGNVRVGSMIIEQTDRMVKCRGFAHDLETNFASTSETMEPTVTKRGEPFSEGMRAVVAKACLAKAWRDALFKVVPRALCKPIEAEVRKLAAGEGKSLESRRLAAMQWVNKLGIDVARVFKALGIAGEGDIGSDQLARLFGLKTAIKDGEVKIEDAFPSLTPEGGAPSFTQEPEKKPVPKIKVLPPEPVPASEIVQADPVQQPVSTAPEPPAVGTSDGEGAGGGSAEDLDKATLLADLNERMEKDGVSAKTVKTWAAANAGVASASILTKDYTTEQLQVIDERWNEVCGN